MPGMDARAPERTDTSSGFFGSPNFLPSSFSMRAIGGLDVRVERRRQLAADLVELGADLGGDGEAGRNRQRRCWSSRRGSRPCRRAGSSCPCCPRPCRRRRSRRASCVFRLRGTSTSPWWSSLPWRLALWSVSWLCFPSSSWLASVGVSIRERRGLKAPSARSGARIRGGLVCADQASRPLRTTATSDAASRSCPMLSRSRTVTVWSSRLWKSTVMHHGVPISSWRR